MQLKIIHHIKNLRNVDNFEFIILVHIIIKGKHKLLTT